MNDFWTDIFPWLLIIASLIAFAIVNAKEKAGGRRKSHQLIKGICAALTSTALLYIVLKRSLLICALIGAAVGVVGFILDGKASTTGK
ncbi:MAG: hypothetical protein Q4D43_10940 [Clostridia bacterium]|nr:hypothetical protein [Clostridia bacterium]